MMDIKEVLLILFISVSLVSCSNEHKTYYDTGEIKEVYEVEDGMKNGVYIMYYKNGEIKEESNWINDVRSGKYKTYYPSGALEYESTFEQGMVKGEVINYYKNGQIQSRGKAVENNKVGKWVAYRTDGTVEEYVEYIVEGGKSYPNQIWGVNRGGDTIPQRSEYFKLFLVSDTVQPYEINKLKVNLITGHFGDSSEISIEFTTADTLIDFRDLSRASAFRAKGDSNNTAIYEVNRAEPGIYYIQGQIFEFIKPKGSKNMDVRSRVYYFRRSFYVDEPMNKEPSS